MRENIGYVIFMVLFVPLAIIILTAMACLYPVTKIAGIIAGEGDTRHIMYELQQIIITSFINLFGKEEEP